MTRSFSYLCITITNAICLTGLWILIAVFPDLFAGIESLTTILKSLICLGFIMDSFVCFAEFLMVWLKVQVPPVYFYWLSVAHYLIDITIYLYHPIRWGTDTRQSDLFFWIFNGICTFKLIFMNEQLSNVVDGINNPVAYPVM